jgi:hypothetical protein
MPVPPEVPNAGAGLGRSPRQAGSRPSLGARFFDPEADLRVGATVWDWLGRWLLVALLALLVHGAWKVGPTYDEHFYIAAGHSYLENGDFSLNREHPPLLKYLAGAPLRYLISVPPTEHAPDLLNYPLEFFYQKHRAQQERYLFLSRLPFCLLTALCAWAVFRTSRRLFGPRAAFAGLLLFAANPNVLAHGRLAALDAGAATFLFLCLVSYVGLLERANAWRALAAGVCFGLALLAKFSNLVAIPALAVLTVYQCLRRLSLAPLWHFLRVSLVGFAVFAAGYGFEAKSINEAWADPRYATEIEPAPRSPAELAAALEQRLPVDARGRAQPVAAAATAALALEEWRSLLSAGEPQGLADRAARALLCLAPDGEQGIEPAPEELRKRAFELVLEANPENVPYATKLELLPRLADRTLLYENGSDLPADERGLEAWADWYDTHRVENWDRVLFQDPRLERFVRRVFGDARPIPLFSALKGIDYQLAHGSEGHASYYRGKVLVPGSSFADGNPYPWYYADVLWVKNPVGFVAAAGLGLVLALLVLRRWTLLHVLGYVGLPAAMFYLFMSSNALMGVRYLMPLFPFLAVLAARVELVLPRLGILLGVAALGESIWIQPHQLMYYNALAGGPTGGPAITVVGDDWGQDARSLGTYFKEHRAAIEAAGGLYYDQYLKADLEAFGLESAQPVRPNVQGIVAVHANSYYRQPQRYAWLADYQPYRRLGWSVWLYDTRLGPPGGKLEE